MKGAKGAAQKKKTTKKDLVIPMHEANFCQYLEREIKDITTSCNQLRSLYRTWGYHKGIYGDNSLRVVLIKYLEYYSEQTERDRFAGVQRNIVNSEQMISMPSEESFFKAFELFRGPWAVRFSNRFLQKLKEQQDKGLLIMLAYVSMFSKGNWMGTSFTESPFGRVREQPVDSPIPYNAFYSSRIYNNRTVIFNVGVERWPVMDRQQRITRFQFTAYMLFHDVLGDMDMLPVNIEAILKRFCAKVLEDTGRNGFGDDLIKDDKVMKRYKREDILFEEIQNESFGNLYTIEKRRLHEQGIGVYLPTYFKTNYISNVEANSLIYSTENHRWVTKDALLRAERVRFNEFQRKVNEEILKKYVDFNSAKNLVELLKKIPNFKIKLTEEEKNVVGENGNVMVIGRSGTGKTTCAVLRLFSIEMLFKIRVSLNKKKFGGMLKDTRFMADDIDQAIGLHSIFVTASPVLTNEIERYYRKLTEQIKEELEKKRKRQQEQAQKKREQADFRKKEEASEIVDAQPAEDSRVEEAPSVEVEEIKPQEVREQKTEELQETKPTPKAPKADQEQVEHMNEQFSGIEMEEGKGIEVEQEDEDIELEELENKINKFSSLNDMEETDFPGFFTVRALIMMLDGTLTKPFFIRNQNQQVVGQQSKVAWHNEQRGVMMIENYYRKMNAEHENPEPEQQADEVIDEQVNYSDEEELQHEYQRQIRLREQRNKQDFTTRLKSKGTNKLSFEVDYDYFAVHFWPQIKKRYYTAKNISAHLIWTEIYSSIKGSARAHLYPACYIPEKLYLEQCTNVFLSTDQKKEIFESFCQYERWKRKMCAYDMMDVVNYLLAQMRFRGYAGPSIHYLMIDEVQDLPHATLYLLTKVAEQGVFFSGDTAQTIAKGVGFRFGDLKNMFSRKDFDTDLKLTKPTVMQLTINFRSHNNILQLANSIISIIEILFPATIDRLKKERSDLNGPKPIILSDSDTELLFFVLCGEEMYKSQIERTEGDLMKRPPLEFGCEQVIIVRDQESKKRIPAILQHALCLTIYEAKGLQFNDVILFNFFAESKCADKWNLVKFLKIIDEEVSLKDYQKMVTQHKKMLQQDEQKEEGEKPAEEVLEETKCIEEVQIGDKVIIKKIKQDAQMAIKDINDFGELCSELKMLYTAITRPRNTLIIYDEDSSSRKPLEKYWEKIGVTEVVTKDMLDMATTTKKRKGSSSAAQVQIFNSLVAKTGASEWKQQGIKMFKRKYFEQAMKCFQMSGDEDLYKKAQANAMADESTKEIIEVESQLSYLKGKLYSYAEMTKQDLKRARTKLKNQETRALENFCHAGELFRNAELYKQAGQCFFSGREYAKAEECFRKINMVKQVAESLYMQHQYIEAGQFFAEGGDYLKAIECYDLVNDWQGVLKVINKFSDVIPVADKQALIRKYAALCLEDLVQQIQFENEVPEGGEKKQVPQIIHQRDSDEEEESDEEDEDSDPEVQAEKEVKKKLSEEISRKQSEQISRKESEELSRKMSEEELSRKQSEEVPKQNSQEQPSEEVQELKPIPKQDSSVIELKKDMSDSFANLNEQSQEAINPPNDNSSSFADLNEPDMEAVKSIADPHDEWLGGAALSEIHHKTQSEYSVIENEQLDINSQARIIKTKGNIFVQDDVMRRIINIVSIVNTSIVDYLKQLKGHQSLITNAQIEPREFQLNDFEDIDPEFICKVLDTLESFRIYKLCIFVCNRYHLPSKLGRYLASIALKYSLNANSNMTITPSLLAPNPHRKSELEKGILASIALHTIFENVNPDFLKVKIGDSSRKATETLGEYSVSGLILEGLYKKVVFMVDTEESLSILSNYMEADMYRNVFLNNFMKSVDHHSFTFLSTPPKSDAEIQLTVLTLQSSIWRRLSRLQSELISSYYLKEYHAKELLRESPLPEYLKYNRTFWSYIDNSSGKVERNEFKQSLQSISEMLLSVVDGTAVLAPHVIYDIVTCAILVFHFPAAEELMEELTVWQFANIYSGVQSLYFLMTNLQAGNPNSWWIIRSMLSVYQARIIHGSKIMRILGDSYIFIHRSSPIVGDLQDKRRKDLQKHQEKHAGKQKAPKFREEAFFIEQELNIIIAPFFPTFKKIRQRILKKLVGFSNLYAKLGSLHSTAVTMEDHIEQQFRFIFSFFMKDEQIRLKNMIAFLREKNKKQLRQENKLQLRQAELLKAKAHKPSIGMRLLSHTGTAEDEANIDRYDQDAPLKQKINLDQKLFDSVYLPARSCHPLLKDYMLKKFLSYSRSHKDQIVSGKFLYVTAQNKHYREYTRACGGYYLYDAIEFKLFNRLDMYAFNMQDVLPDLSIEDQCFYVQEILMLLLVHYNVLTSHQKAMKMEVMTGHLKFLEGLKFQEYINKEQYHKDFREAIADGQPCIFSCNYRLSSEEDADGIQKLMLEYLQLARTLMTQNEPVPTEQVVYWYPMLISYIVNLNQISKDVFEQLMYMIEDISPHFEKEHKQQLEDLSTCQNEKELIVWRNRLLDGSIKLSEVLFHEVKLKVQSDSKRDVIESEKDYNAHDIVLARRLIAAKKIKRWWKRGSKERKHYTLEELKARVEEKCITGWPVFLYKLPEMFYPDFLPHTTRLTQQLISFYLENVVNSALDLHFILMTLNKLVDLRDKFIKLALSEYLQFQAEMADYEQELRDIDRDILAWKSDEKWSAKNQVQLKKKKVFEIKWLTKVIKKRAGIKKQALLQDKKKMLKRLQG